MSQQYKISQSQDGASQKYSSRPHSNENIEYHQTSPSQYKNVFQKYSRQNQETQPIHQLTKIENQNYQQINESMEQNSQVEFNSKNQAKNIFIEREQINKESVLKDSSFNNQGIIQPTESKITLRQQQNIHRVQSIPTQNIQRGNIAFQPQVLRHTITNEKAANNIINSNKSINIQNGQFRSSLPANTQQNQLFDKRIVMTPNIQHQKISITHQPLNIVHQREQNFVRQHHLIGHQNKGSFINQPKVYQNTNYNMIPPISNVRPKDFIQGQTQLQKSQIVYRDRRQVHGNQLIQNQRRNIHQEPRYSAGHQNNRRSSSVSPNVKFNYNMTNSTANLQQNFNKIQNNKGVQKVIPVNTNVITQVHSFPNTTKYIQSAKIIQRPVQKNVQKIQIKQINWQEKYFSIYSRLQHFSSTFQIVVSDFASFERNLQNLNDERALKSTISKHKKLNNKINQLQQEISTIIHQEKPSSTKTVGIVQQKYQRLLQNYAKLHEEHNRMKVSFQKKINQSIKSLQIQNDTLKQKLSQITEIHKSPQKNQHFAEEFAQMSEQIKQMKKYISSLQKSKSQNINQPDNSATLQLKQVIDKKNKQIQYLSSLLNGPASNHQEQLLNISKQLDFAVQQKQQIGQLLAKCQQKNIILQSQIQRISQQSLTFSESLKTKNWQIQKLKEKNSNNQTLNNNQNSQNQLISKLQDKIKYLQAIKIQLQQEINKKSLSNKQILTLSTQVQRLKIYEQLIEKTTKSITQIEFENSKLIQKNKLLLDQIQRLNQKIKALQSKNSSQSKLVQTIPQLSKDMQLSTSVAQYQFTINLLRNQVARRQQQIERQAKLFDQRVKDLTDQLKIAYNDREHTHKKHLDKVDNLQKQIQKKENKIRQLREKIVEYQQQKKINSFATNLQGKDISQSDNLKYQSNQIIKLNNQIQRLRRSQNQKERDIKKYCQEIQILQKQVGEYRQQNLTLKRQTTDFSNTSFQLQTLNEVLSKKNMEILQLKNKLFQKQAFLIQNSNLKKQNERLSSEVLKMSNQIQGLNQSQLLLSKNIREMESTQIFSLNQKIKNIQNEYNLLLQVNGRKDQQIIKLRQNNNLLTTNIQELQEQHNRLNHQWKNFQKDMIRQKQQFNVEVQKLTKKVSQYQKNVLEKSVLQHKLIESQKSLNNYKFDYEKMQQTLKQQKLKIKNLESQNQDFSSQIESLNEKLKQFQKKYNELTKKNKKTIDQLMEKNKQLSSQKTKIQKGKILELQNSLKHKDNKIWKLEKQLEQMHQRFDQFAQENQDEHKIIHLQQKVKQYEARLFSQNLGKIGVKAPDYEASQIFQKKIIYDLKEQNDRLRQFINGRSSRPTKGRNSNRSQLEVVQQVHDQQMEEVQKRLVDFNQKLQHLIRGEHSYLNTQYNKSKISQINQSPMKKSKSPGKSPIKNFNYSNINLAQNEAYEVRQMKIKYVELQKYCNNLQAQVLSNQKVSKRGSQTIITEQLNYHKEKNRQLQERVDQLLGINNQLKANLQKLLKGGSTSNSNTYYIQQINQFKIQITSLQSKIKKLLDQNRILKTQLSDMQSSNSYDKSFQFESKISELTRKNNEFSYLKSSIEKQLQELKHQLKQKSDQLLSLKSSMQLSSNKQTSLISQHRQKIDDYQMEITRLTNKAKISESEIQRLNQIIKKKQSQGSDEVHRWKNKSNQLQEQLNKLRHLLESEQTNQGNTKAQTGRLTSQIRSLQFQVQTASQINNQLTKKIQQIQLKNKDLQNQLSDMTYQFKSRKNSQSQLQKQGQQYELEIVKFKNQIAFLNAEIQRLMEDFKKKQTSYQSQIQILQGKASQFQYENISAKKSSEAWQISKKQYQNDIQRYVGQIEFLKNQIANHCKKIQIYQSEIENFKSKISILESQRNSLKRSSISLQTSKSQYESVIAKLQNKISILSSELQRIKGTSNNLQSFKLQSEQELITCKNQICFLQAQIQRLTQQFKRKQQNYEQTIFNLKSIIQKMQNQNSIIKGTTNNFEVQRQQFEFTISQMKNQITMLKSQLQRVNLSWSQKYQECDSSYRQSLLQIQRLKARIGQLQLLLKSQSNGTKFSKQQIQSLKRQIGHLNEQLLISQQQTQSLILQLHQIQFKVQLMRSIYIQIETLIQQQQLVNQKEFINIKERIFQQINKGLQVCSQIFE